MFSLIVLLFLLQIISIFKIRNLSFQIVSMKNTMNLKNKKMKYQLNKEMDKLYAELNEEMATNYVSFETFFTHEPSDEHSDEDEPSDEEEHSDERREAEHREEESSEEEVNEYTLVLEKKASRTGGDKYNCQEIENFNIYLPQNISRMNGEPRRIVKFDINRVLGVYKFNLEKIAKTGNDKYSSQDFSVYIPQKISRNSGKVEDKLFFTFF